jgi:hypothetical protein
MSLFRLFALAPLEATAAGIRRRYDPTSLHHRPPKNGQPL